MKNRNSAIDKAAYDKTYYAANKEQINERNRIYYLSHKEEIIKRSAEYRKKHKAKVLKNQRRSYRKHRDKRNVAKRDYHLKHPHKVWSQRSFAAHKRKNHTLLFTTDDLEELAKSTSKCSICGKKFNWYEINKKTVNGDSPTLDRINNETVLVLEDVWIVCMRCNVMKNSMPFDEFIRFCKMVVKKFG